MVSMKLVALASWVGASYVEGAPHPKEDSGVFTLNFEVHDTNLNGEFQKRSNVEGFEFEKYINKNQMYVTHVKVGSQKQKLGLQIDTGSSDLWVPARNLTHNSVTSLGSYDEAQSKTGKSLKKPFVIQYGDYTYGVGEYVTDTVIFGSGKPAAVLKDFEFGVVYDTNVTGNGLLGIGLESLEASIPYNATRNNLTGEYVNFPIALKNAGYISKATYSLFSNTPLGTSGTLLFGGKDLEKFEGDLVKLEHSGPFYDLDVKLQNITINDVIYNVSEPMTLDSGTTLTYLPKKPYNSVIQALGGDGSLDSIYDLPIVECVQSGNITYNFDGISIDVPIADLIMEVSKKYCVAGILEGDNILGDNFLLYAYVYYDLEDSSISLANVRYSKKTSIELS